MNRKYRYNRKEPTSSEIKNLRNFNEVKSKFENQSIPRKRSSKFLGKNQTFYLSVIFVTIVSLGLYYILNNIQKHPEITDLENHEQLDFRMIDPPLENIDIDYTKFVMESASDSGFYISPRGTKLRIPPDCFVYHDGKKVEGEVELYFREFHDPVDFFVSGINMEYDTLGQKKIFESAGMIDMHGKKDGQNIFIAEGKEIHVSMASAWKGNHYNVYYLDTVMQKWEYRLKDKVTDAKSVQESHTIYSQNYQFNFEADVERQMPDDETMLEMNRQLTEAKLNYEDQQALRPEEPRKVSPDRYSFDLDIKEDEFPELQAYKDVCFEVLPEQMFTPKVFETEWNDIKLEKADEELVYLVTLSNDKQKKQYRVQPVFKEESFTEAKKQYNQQFEEYTALLKDKQRKVDSIAAVINKMTRRNKLPANEVEMQDTARVLRNSNYEQASLNALVTRTFAISQFGIWNSDFPSEYPKGKNLTARFAQPNNSNPGFKTIYQAVNDVNALYNYKPDRYNQFSYNKRKENLLWAVNKSGKLCVFRPEKFEDIPGKVKNYTFVMQECPTELSSVEDVKSFLDL
ncbi:MAG: hypothetical protein C0594_16255 [Marinilabiliales bacterium]|nr:MAG: hypothetical protein C0594_16255 [Marinilabiliales bacterium]